MERVTPLSFSVYHDWARIMCSRSLKFCPEYRFYPDFSKEMGFWPNIIGQILALVRPRHGYLDILDMNEKYIVYQMGPIFRCNKTDQLKKDCSAKYRT